MVNGVTSRPFSAETLPPMRWGETEDHSDKIIKVSRERYSLERADVEAKIEKWAGALFEAEEEAEGPKEKYKTRCWICGKEVNVPFKPDDVRPVYCSEDLKKVESGEIAPAAKRKPIGGGTRASDKYSDSLSGLGIEFGAEEKKIETSPAPTQVHRPVFQPRRENAPAVAPHNASPRTGHFVLKQDSKPERTMSLSDLRRRGPAFSRENRHPEQDRNKKGPDLEGLRSLLKDTVVSKDEAEKKESRF